MCQLAPSPLSCCPPGTVTGCQGWRDGMGMGQRMARLRFGVGAASPGGEPGVPFPCQSQQELDAASTAQPCPALPHAEVQHQAPFYVCCCTAPARGCGPRLVFSPRFQQQTSADSARRAAGRGKKQPAGMWPAPGEPAAPLPGREPQPCLQPRGFGVGAWPHAAPTLCCIPPAPRCWHPARRPAALPSLLLSPTTSPGKLGKGWFIGIYELFLPRGSLPGLGRAGSRVCAPRATAGSFSPRCWPCCPRSTSPATGQRSGAGATSLGPAWRRAASLDAASRCRGQEHRRVPCTVPIGRSTAALSLSPSRCHIGPRSWALHVGAAGSSP